MMFYFAAIVSLLIFTSFPVLAASDSSTELIMPTAIPQEESILFQDIPSVYGASKYEQKVTEAPSSITIITSDEIKKYGYRTLSDILQSVNGFYVTSDRNYSFVGMRGFNRPGDYNSRILVLIDGHRLNENIYDGALFGTEEVIDVDIIDRIEIIRGPSSSLYGTNAFFGVINILTKRGRDIAGVEVSTALGSYGTRKGRFTYGSRHSTGLELFFSGMFFDSDGHKSLFFKEFNDPATNNGRVRNADADNGYRLFTKMSFTDFTLQGGYKYRLKQVPTASFGSVFNTRQTKTSDEHGFIDLRYEHELPYQIGLTARAYYDRFFYHGRYLFDYGTPEEPARVLNHDFSFGEWWGTEVKLSKRLWNRLRISVGGEFRDNSSQDQKNNDYNPFTSYLHDRRKSRIWAIYVQNELTLLENLILNASLRYDHYDSFGGTTSPRLALIYNLPKTSIKLLYGEAFRAPTVFEQFYVSSLDFKANPKLKPETISSYELVIERYLTDHLRASLAGYYYTVDNLITQTLDPKDNLLFFDNVESLEAKGIEFDFEGKWASGFEGRLSYALQQAKNQVTGKILTNSPQSMLKLNLIVPLWRDKVFAGLDNRFLSARKTLSGGRAQSYFVSNLTFVAHKLPGLEGVELSGSLYNLFDEHYGDPGSGEHRQDVIFQDGRTFWLRLKYAF
jgi:iron complex outermembrane receptor protein